MLPKLFTLKRAFRTTVVITTPKATTTHENEFADGGEAAAYVQGMTDLLDRLGWRSMIASGPDGLTWCGFSPTGVNVAIRIGQAD